MEIFQTIWTALTTPNVELINLFRIPLIFIEMTVTMLLFTTILDIHPTRKQKLLYVFVLSLWSILLSVLLNSTILNVLNILILPLAIMFFFKTSFLKSIIAEIISFFSMTISETLFLKLYLEVFNITAEVANTTPIYRIAFALIMYTFIFLLYKLAKHFKFNITLLDNIPTRNKALLVLSFIIGIITIFVQNYVNSYYSDILPTFLIVLSTFTLLSFFTISMYSVSKTTQLQIAQQSLEEAQLYNKSLKILHDNVRAFKHDFSNIVQAIGRIC